MITGTPGSGTPIGLQITHVGGGNWVGTSPGFCQSPAINVAVTEFDRAGVYTKTAGSKTTVDDTSYKIFEGFSYNDLIKRNDLPAPNQNPESNNYGKAKYFGSLTGKGRFGLFVNEF